MLVLNKAPVYPGLCFFWSKFNETTVLKYITKTIWILSFVSLLTDTASEMLYPVMPIYLKSIGFSIVLIGILEGFAEAIAGLSKGYFGKLSDHSGKRVPFVQFGYALSAISKPMMAFFTFPVWILFSRFTDRLGKGIRTGARDALLSDETTAATKATVFGFHRSMDTIGAVIGPTFALLFLYAYPGSYKMLFFLAFIPGLTAIATSFLLKEKPNNPLPSEKVGFFSFFAYWKNSRPEYRKLITGLLFFALINSSDIFLLLKAKEAGLSDIMVIGIYIFYNLVYAVMAFPMGILADNKGIKKVFIFGLFFFSMVYTGMAFNTNLYLFFAIFFLYGVYASATEGVSKAWITNISVKTETATAIGTYTAFQSICTMLSSSIMGLIWYKFGSTTALSVTGILTMILVVYFVSIPADSQRKL